MPIKVVTEMSIFDRVRAGSPSRTKVSNGKRTYYYNAGEYGGLAAVTPG
jgi:hypothetical protein